MEEELTRILWKISLLRKSHESVPSPPDPADLVELKGFYQKEVKRLKKDVEDCFGKMLGAVKEVLLTGSNVDDETKFLQKMQQKYEMDYKALVDLFMVMVKVVFRKAKATDRKFVHKANPDLLKEMNNHIAESLTMSMFRNRQ